MPDDLFDIENKVTIVSGGSRGIGFALARGFAKRGARVTITGRNEDTLKAAAATIEGTAHKVATNVCDVSDVEAIKRSTAEVADTFGQLDVLINVAGVNIRQPTLEFDSQQYDFVVDINQKGAFFMSQEVGRRMIDQGFGAIINIDSLNTYAPVKNVTPYAMSKHAMVAMTRSMAMEWGPHGIRVNTIAPGFILTDLTKKLWSDPTMQDWGRKNTPLGRLGDPDDMVGAAVFLASDAAKFMTGQVVRVDGGFTAGLNWPIPEGGGQ